MRSDVLRPSIAAAERKALRIHGVGTTAGLAAIGVCAIDAGLTGELDPIVGGVRMISDAVANMHQWTTGNRLATITLLCAAGAIYALLPSVPFVPAMELGLALMVLTGSLGVLMVYLFTVAGLALAFATGRRLERASADAGSQPEVINRFIAYTGIAARVPAAIISHPAGPYLLTALLINLPGNSVLGGGGIALLSGYSRTQGWRAFLLTVALATAPVPLLLVSGLLEIELLSA